MTHHTIVRILKQIGLVSVSPRATTASDYGFYLRIKRKRRNAPPMGYTILYKSNPAENLPHVIDPRLCKMQLIETALKLKGIAARLAFTKKGVPYVFIPV